MMTMSEDKTAMNGAQIRYRKACQGQPLQGSEGLTVTKAALTAATGILVGIDTDNQRCFPPTIISSFTGTRGENILCLCPPGIHLPPLARRRSLLSCNKGLTFVEIAVVVIVIAILAGLGSTMIGPVTQRIKINSTTDYLAAGKEAIIGYYLSRRQSPCGATETCTSPDTRFSTLTKTTDAFNGPLYYIYSGNLRTDGASKADVCGISSTFITLRVCHDTPCTTLNSTSIDNVAFVLLSGGENINKQTNGNGNITAATTVTTYDPGTDNVPDGDAADTDSAGTAINRVQKYDDLYTYVTLNELKDRAGCAKQVSR